MTPPESHERPLRISRPVVAALVTIAAIVALAVAAPLPYRSKADLHVSAESNPTDVPFVAGGGLGEEIHLQIRVSTFHSNQKLLNELSNLAWDAEPSLFRILAETADGEIEVKPTHFHFAASRCDNTGAVCNYVADIPLVAFIKDSQKPPQAATLRVLMANEFVAMAVGPQNIDDLAARPLRVPLHPQPFSTASFTDRLHSLAAGLPISDVHRILGKPFADHSVDPKLIDAHRKYSRQLDYRNPDYKQYATPGRDEKKDVVWLFFDANGRLIEYAEFIYDC